jgi:ubiquinone/menaquinone biosynthesis C-methylase UbiE
MNLLMLFYIFCLFIIIGNPFKWGFDSLEGLTVMKMYLPNKNFLQKTSEVDYYHWNYQFPIKYIIRFRLEAILNLLGDKTYSKILEIGTGSGIFLPELSKHCRKLYASDVHSNMDAVKKLCDQYSIDVELQQCPMENLNFPSHHFDAIIAISVLEFVDDLEKSFNEVKRVMNAGGIFLTICPQKSSFLDFVLSLYSREDPEDEFKQSRKIVSSMLEKNFNVLTKRIFPPVIGSILPVYCYYKLTML